MAAKPHCPRRRTSATAGGGGGAGPPGPQPRPHLIVESLTHPLRWAHSSALGSCLAKALKTHAVLATSRELRPVLFRPMPGAGTGTGVRGCADRCRAVCALSQSLPPPASRCAALRRRADSSYTPEGTIPGGLYKLLVWLHTQKWPGTEAGWQGGRDGGSTAAAAAAAGAAGAGCQRERWGGANRADKQG